MTTILAAITTSVDGYIAGPNDRAGRGLGDGGERLHHWVFGRQWTYDDPGTDEGRPGEDEAVLQEATARTGAIICGRGMYDAGDAWGGSNPWPVPLFVLTHRLQDQPPAGGGFTFVDDLGDAVRRATAAAGDRDVAIAGGGDVIRQALRAGIVDELTITIAPVILGAGKRIFEGFDLDVTLEHIGPVRQSPFATHIRYRVAR